MKRSKMKTIGTLKEWLVHKPDAILAHPDLQMSVEVTNFKFHAKGEKCTYYSHHPDGEPMTPWFGAQCPYEVNGKVFWTALFVYTFAGCGSTYPISKRLAEDNRWEEVVDVSDT